VFESILEETAQWLRVGKKTSVLRNTTKDRGERLTEEGPDFSRADHGFRSIYGPIESRALPVRRSDIANSEN